MDQLFTNATDIRCFRGCPATGKTQTLIDRIVELKTNGVDPENIVIFSASPDAACALRQRLVQQVNTFADALTVCTPRSFALNILATEGAQAYTGRTGHMAFPHEENFLLEDMKSSGLRSRRLKEMLKFFYRTWTELEDDAENAWLITGEEASVHTLLKEYLVRNDIMLEPEVCNLAINYLRQSSETLHLFTAAHVLADDFHAMSRASQALACVLAGESLTIASDHVTGATLFDSYPYAKGLDEFCSLHNIEAVELSQCHRPENIANACTAWRELSLQNNIQETLETSSVTLPHGNATVLECSNPGEEFAQVTNLVAKRISQGMKASDIFIAVPNRTWRVNIVRHLNATNIRTSQKSSLQTLASDVRELAYSQTAQAFTLLQLVANPTSNAAWRSWCGFGDYLTHSDVFLTLKSFTNSTGNPLPYINALETLAHSAKEQQGANTVKVLTTFEEARCALSALSNMRGLNLLNAIASTVAEASHDQIVKNLGVICGPITADDTAHGMIERAYHRLHAKAFEDTSNTVKVGLPTDAAGQEFELVIHMGFVNGFVPHRDAFDATKKSIEQRQHMHVEVAHTLQALAGCASEELVLSYFTHIDPESAERLKMKIERLRLVRGKRTCIIAASEFLNVL